MSAAPYEEFVVEPVRGRLAVLACGAVAREVLAAIRANGWDDVAVVCLPASLHQTPGRIAGAVDEALGDLTRRYEAVFVAYADCGTAGALDAVLARHDVERLPGAHCYGFFAGGDAWERMQEEEPGTFYLTDFLARHFDALVWRGLGLDRHPDLAADVFRNYRRLVYLAQTDDEELAARARTAADRLGLELDVRFTGDGDLPLALTRFVEGRRPCPSSP